MVVPIKLANKICKVELAGIFPVSGEALEDCILFPVNRIYRATNEGLKLSEFISYHSFSCQYEYNSSKIPSSAHVLLFLKTVIINSQQELTLTVKPSL